MEIERKWLININDIPFNLNELEHFDIEQAYISFNPTIRIRKISNINKYILTIKSSSKDNGLSREEKEIFISESEYKDLLNKKEGIVLSKTRYLKKIDESHFYEIDLFHDIYEGLAYMEVEFKDVNEANDYIAPEWALKELTSDRKFTNASLAKKQLNIKDIYLQV